MSRSQRGVLGLKSRRVKNAGAHTAPTKYGMGDNYGSGYRARIGRIRGSTVGFESLSKKKLAQPPRSLA